jgi:hypothetical protein
VTAEKGLGAGEDVPDHNRRSQRVHNVLVIGVQQQPIVDGTWVTHAVPENPITALMVSSFCIEVSKRMK